MVLYSEELNYKTEPKIIVAGICENKPVAKELEGILSVLKTKKPKLFNFGEITEVYPEDLAAGKVVLAGLGNKTAYCLKDIQTVIAKASKAVNGPAVIDLDSFTLLNGNAEFLAEKITETYLLVKYEFSGYKTGEKKEKQDELIIKSSKPVAKAVENGCIHAEGVNHARDLINEPRNKLTPAALADYAKGLAARLNIECRIYDKPEIEALGMGAFLAVNKGSKEPAKLIHLKYRNNNDGEVTALIGKGLTYDSGGYSIKPKDGMAGMKGDMGGAASVLGAIEIIARKHLKANVDVVIAATENLISSEAIVPDDVVVSMSGKTIEILNTDAEGRLTLVDAVTFAKKNGAAKIIDAATLTGGVVTALGHEFTGMFTNNEEFLSQFKKAAAETGEPVWQLPVDEFRERTRKSDVADYNNSPGRDGHASFGAALIGEFALETPWIHLDIAGTSDLDKPHLLGPSGGTGVMARTLAHLFE